MLSKGQKIDIGTAITYARKNANLTQTQLAKSCDITSAALCQIEKGHRAPSLKIWTKILSALGLTSDEVCTVARVCPLCQRSYAPVSVKDSSVEGLK